MQVAVAEAKALVNQSLRKAEVEEAAVASGGVLTGAGEETCALLASSSAQGKEVALEAAVAENERLQFVLEGAVAEIGHLQCALHDMVEKENTRLQLAATAGSGLDTAHHHPGRQSTISRVFEIQSWAMRQSQD